MPYKNPEDRKVYNSNYSREHHASHKGDLIYLDKKRASSRVSYKLNKHKVAPGKKNEYNRRWREKYPDRWRRLQLHIRCKNHGITVSQYEEALERQVGRCWICLVAFSGLNKSPNIDHDHKSGNFRGLLCGQCNIGLGAFCDDIERMRTAISYLEGGYAQSSRPGGPALVKLPA